MLERIIDLSLRHRLIVVLAVAGAALVGFSSLLRLPFDAFPDTTPVQVTVNATAPALSPLEIERQITFALEQAIGGLPGLSGVRSLSKFGFSQVTATFEDEVDIHLARQVVSERLATVELPAGVSRPALGPITTALGEVFQYVVKSERLSPSELRTLHHWVVRPQLLQVPGVAEINTWGGQERELHVVIDPELLVKYALTLDDAARAVTDSNLNVGGGTVSRGGEGRLIQGVGLLRGVDDLRQVVIAAVNGVPIYVGDVAEVRDGHEIRRGAVTEGGQGEAVLGLGFMLMGENSREVTRRLEARLADASKSLPAGVEIEPLYSRSHLVEEVLRTVRKNLLEGALLVVAVLFIFMGSLRAGLIVALAIPLSMLFAFDAMLRFGIAGTLMSLGAIDFGLVVDSSVIMVENASRRLSEDVSGRSVRDVVREAALEVRRPTLFGELVIASVYLPVLALEGVEGKFFRPMALTVIFALAGSMILSITLMPVLASLGLRRRSAARGSSLLMRGLLGLYRPVLERALRHRPVVLGVAAVLVAGGAWLGVALGSDFVPRLREGSIVINTVRLAGVSLEESVRYGTRIEQKLLAAFPDEIDRIWTRTGTPEVATDPMGLEVSDIFITLHPREGWKQARTQDELVESLSRTMEGLPGMRAVFTQPIEMRMNEITAGIRSDLGLKIFGDDFDVLEESASQARRIVEAVPGAADVTVEQLTGQPIMQVSLDRAALARHGVSARTVLQVVEALGGLHVGELAEEQMRFDITLRLHDRYLSSPERLAEVLVETPSGARVPLGTLTRLERVEGPSTIQREWGKRRTVVQANVRGRDLGSFVAEVREALDARLTLPPGYYVQLGGQFENLERARKRLMLVIPAALLLVLALLYLTYGRVTDALRVFTGVPFAAVGGLAALWVRDMPFTISAGVGFVALSGVAVLGDMVLVSRIRQLLAEGRPLLEAVRGAAETRLRPVLMTALVAALGFVPMALNTGIGAEVQRPLATVVIGGLLTSTLATLVVMPVLYATLRAGSSRAVGG